MLALLGTGVSRHMAQAGLSLSSRKRPELPRMLSTPRMTTFPPVPVTCDAVRSKCREMLTAALRTDRECQGTAQAPLAAARVLGGLGASGAAGEGCFLQMTTWPSVRTASACRPR